MRRHLELLTSMQTRQGLKIRVAAPPDFEWERFEPISLSSRPDLFNDLYAARQITRLTGASDLVHAHGFRAAWVTAMALRHRRIPFVFTVHNLLPDNPGALARFLLRFIFRRVDAIICVSDFIRQALCDRGTPYGKLNVIYNAVDMERFNPVGADKSGFRQQCGIEEETPLMGIVARIVSWKGHQDLIDALPIIRKQIPEVMLAVIGKEDHPPAGSLTDRLRQRAVDREVGDSIRWTGWSEDVRSVFAALDVVCMPSYREPFGLSAVEAMAMKKPVVAYRSGALPEIISDGTTGILTTEGDIQAFARSILAILKSAEMRHRMGECARESVLARFHAQKQSDEVLKLYQSCLQMRGG
jgi:glycosyltransferase involved in cell wall biosynthesis